MAKRTSSRSYTVLLVPNDKGKTISVRISGFVVKTLLLVFIIFLAGAVLLMVNAGEIALKLQLVQTLRVENERLIEENKQLRIVSQKIAHIESIANYLQKVASISKNEENNQPGKVSKTPPTKVVYESAFSDSVVTSDYLTHRKKYFSGKPPSPEEYMESAPNIPPVEGWITRHFLPPSDSASGHTGIDFAASHGTPIRSTASGVVDTVYEDVYYGLFVVIRHGMGFVTRYGHCSQILVSPRDRIKRGQTIALVGNTGRSTAPHLHYEVIKDGKLCNPSDFIISHRD